MPRSKRRPFPVRRRRPGARSMSIAQPDVGNGGWRSRGGKGNLSSLFQIPARGRRSLAMPWPRICSAPRRELASGRGPSPKRVTRPSSRRLSASHGEATTSRPSLAVDGVTGSRGPNDEAGCARHRRGGRVPGRVSTWEFERDDLGARTRGWRGRARRTLPSGHRARKASAARR
jgi:hypothetical protein